MCCCLLTPPGLFSRHRTAKDSEGNLLFRDDKAGSEVAKSAKMKLFEHFVRFGRRRASLNVPHVPSPFLNVEMSEFQRTAILNPTSDDCTTGAIIRDMCGEGAKQKLAKRKLDGVGEVHSACGVANAPDRIRRLQVRSLKLTCTTSYPCPHIAFTLPCISDL